ncbi:MAG: TRZ/ATZ family hydrolase [Pseudomonadota bacterium]
MQDCDLIIAAEWLAPVVPTGVVYARGAVAVRDGRVLAVGEKTSITRDWNARETVERPGCLLTPGLINTHTHAAMTLMRGAADDVPLAEWLSQHIWPLEGEHVSADMVRDGTRLAMAEMIRGGITCFNDMYFFPDTVAEMASAARMRASVGLIVIDFETVWARDANEYLAKGMAVYDEYAGNPLITCQFAPHAPYSVSDATLRRIHTLADQLDIGVHIHLHETTAELRDYLDNHGQRPFAHLQDIGMVNANLLAVHMTALSDEEIAAAGAAGISVAHCPESNLKLASGMAPVAKLLAAGANVALGTDGAASNNDLDLIGEMRTAALLGKGVSGDASALPATTVLEMATINGARALGLEEHCGSIEAGKWADISCIDLRGLHTTPTYDPVAALVYSASRTDVCDVWVAGKPLLTDGELTTIDEAAVRERTQEWAARIHKSIKARSS